MPRSPIISGRIAAITVRSIALRKTVNMPASSAGVASIKRPTDGSRWLLWSRNRHLLVVIAEVERPGCGILDPLVGRLGDRQAHQVPRLGIDPELDGDLVPAHRARC